jgi:hypothetical protein
VENLPFGGVNGSKFLEHWVEFHFWIHGVSEMGMEILLLTWWVVQLRCWILSGPLARR